MIKYRTNYGNTKIDKVDVLRETPKFVVIQTKNFTGSTREDRESKSSSYHNYFDTWEEAHNHILNKAQRTVDSLRLRLESAKGELGNIKGLKEGS